MKIRGNLVGTTLPKPNLDQTDPTKGDYIKGDRSFMSGGGSGGVTPHIGDNGNWWIGEVDTGKPSRGENGISPKITMTETDYGYDMRVYFDTASSVYPIYHGKDADSGNSEVSWNDLKDRPFGAEIVHYEWQEDTEYAEKIEAPGDSFAYFEKISDEAPTRGEILGKWVYAIVDNDGNPIETNIQYTEENVTPDMGGYYTAEPMVVVTADSVTDNGITFTKGIWCPGGYDQSFGFKFIEWKVYTPAKQLDESVIPDTIARTADIPTDDHINELISAKLAEATLVSAEEVAF